MIEKRILFKGSVQGVCFRAHTKKYAEELSLTGTVKNLPDGSVEMIVQGNAEAIDKLVAKLQGSEGPGQVTHLEVEERSQRHHYSNFSILF